MLPRVSQALLKFFEPLALSVHVKSSTQREKERKPELRLISNNKEPLPEPQQTQAPTTPPPQTRSPQPLMTWVQDQLKSMNTGRALDAYESTLKSRKKGARFKKGAVFDQKAE